MLVGDVVKGHLLRAHEIGLAHLVRLLADLAGDGIDHQLHRVADSRTRDAAVRKLRRFVGRHSRRFAAIDRKVIGARKNGADLGRLNGRGEGVGRVGARIDGGSGIERQDLTGGVRIRSHPVMVLAAIRVGRKLLAPILEPAHGMTAAHGKPAEANLFAGQNSLVAEASAHIRRNNANLHLRNLQNLGEAGADHMGKLGCAVQDELSEPGVPLRDEAATLDRRHDLTGGA